jgi:hypothetical protein
VRPPFFVAVSGALLAIVAVGFGPTLYLRVLFDVLPIPAYLYVHGALLTAWFALVVTQAALVHGRRVSTHRRLGWVGVCLGVAVVLASAVVTVRFAERIMRAPGPGDVNLSVMMGFGSQEPLVELAATALWGNLLSLATFTVLVGCAVLMRTRVDAHGRFMLLASLSILPPAVARVSRWPGLGGDLGPLVPIVMLLLLSSMVGFDLYRSRRVHWATLTGGGLIVLGIVAGTLLARSDLGVSVVRRLV